MPGYLLLLRPHRELPFEQSALMVETRELGRELGGLRFGAHDAKCTKPAGLVQPPDMCHRLVSFASC